MKTRMLLFALLAFCVFMVGASPQDNLTVTDGSYLVSTGDQAIAWSTATTTLAVNDIMLASGGTGKYTLIAQANAADPGKRYISIWIIDQDENIPLNKSVLYEEKMIFTDKTPDEIRAGIPLLQLLEKHNVYRETLKDKEGKALKKIRLRDVQIVIRNW
jgi:hypothetical protein